MYARNVNLKIDIMIGKVYASIVNVLVGDGQVTENNNLFYLSLNTMVVSFNILKILFFSSTYSIFFYLAVTLCFVYSAISAKVFIVYN